MKFFVAFAALIAVAVAINRPLASDDDGIAAIIAAIQSPSTDPATAYLLQQQLEQILGSLFQPEPIHVGPVFVDGNQPISVGPVLVDGNHPISVGPVLVDQPEVVAPSPVPAPIPAPTPAAPESQSAPLVQIIVNVQSQQSAEGPSPGLVTSPIEVPVTLPELVHIVDQAPELVNVVDQAPELVNVVDQAPELVNVVDQAPELVNVVDQAPELVNVVDLFPETINVAQPILPPSPVNVPDTLN